MPSTFDTSLTLNSLPHKSVMQAGVQISRSNVTWAASFGSTASVSYGFRSTKPSYNTASNTVGTFAAFTSVQIAATLTIATLWSDLANINLVRAGSGTTGSGAYSDTATILLSDYTSYTDGFGAFAIGGISAKTTAAGSSAGDIYDNMANNSASPSIGTYSWMTLIHELGHAIGLSHPGDYNAQPGVSITYGGYAQYFEDSQQYSVMSYFGATSTGARYNSLYPLTPMLDDIAAVQRIYGANTSTRTGNTTYGFNSNADRDVYKLTSASDQRVMTIYDAGGMDTLDVSGYSTNQSINLNPGSYSNIGALTLNLAIADGTVIENAIGGSGNDVIYANAANNVIDGSAGYDTVVFPGPRSEYRVSRSGTVLTVTDSNVARGGTDTLSNIENLSFSDQDVAATSVDPPSFAIAALDAVKKEGNTGTTPFTFTVTRSGDTSGSANLGYTFAGSGRDAADAADFPASGLFYNSVSFSPGDVSKAITVYVNGDTTVEPDETFTVTLRGDFYSTITTGTATGTILNDDAAVVSPASFTIAAIDTAKKEGNSGSTIFNYTLTRTGDSSAAAAVTYTVTGTGTNAATTTDFVGGALPSGVVSFAAGQTSAGLVIGVAGDIIVEPDETFMVALSGAGLAFTTASVISTILNDDAVVVTPASFAIAAADAIKKEGNSGTTPFTFIVTRSGDTSGSVNLGYSFAGSGPNAADASDFPATGLFYNSVSFSPGDVSKTITVYVNADTTVERDETFTVTLTGDSYSTITTATAIGTILNDDSAIVTPGTFAIAATDAAKKEGNSGTTPFTFTVTRSGDANAAATLAYAVSGSGASPANAADFAGNTLPSGSIAFAAGDTSKTVTVNVAGDGTYEPDETFTVTLSGAGQTFTAASATGTILNDDVPGPVLGIQNGKTGVGIGVNMDAADPGGPNYLANQYIYSGSDDLSIATSAPNVFIHSGSGNDAIQVASGRNVLDGGLGSNFLTGGSGADTFFTDARNPGAVWNTIRNFHEGSAATLWGFTAGVSSYRWEAGLAGAVGSEGATLRANIVGGKGRVGDGIDASITFTGISVAQAQKLQIVTGSQPAGSYLFIYNPGV